MCLLARRQDILPTRDLSNSVANLPLPAGNTKPLAPTGSLQIPSGRQTAPSQVGYCSRIVTDDPVLERQAGTYLHA
jgi:hypothetical protein